MPREIKFRIWDNVLKKMGEPIEILELVKLLSENTLNALHWNIEFSQYTGIQDSEGNDIYEGDILSFSSELLENDFILSVVFKSGSFICHSVANQDMQNSLVEYLYQPGIKIIGNIYQNKDLLCHEK